jgi:glucose-1-phosphate cytidylyltransferase
LLRLDKKGLALRFVEKPVLEDRVNGGFMVFKKKFFDYLRPGELEHPALKRLIAEKQLAVYIHNGFWHSMDTYADVENLNKYWREDPKWKIWKD